jgi:hypothetical protein
MTQQTTDQWQKDMPRCEFDPGGACIANTPKACICLQLQGLKAMRRAFDRTFGETVGQKEE